MNTKRLALCAALAVALWCNAGRPVNADPIISVGTNIPPPPYAPLTTFVVPIDITGAVDLTFWQFDLSLTKTFQVREMQKVEFRAEAFNILNKFIMMNPTFDLNSNLFGKVTAARDPRIMQFALKYLF